MEGKGNEPVQTQTSFPVLALARLLLNHLGSLYEVSGAGVTPSRAAESPAARACSPPTTCWPN